MNGGRNGNACGALFGTVTVIVEFVTPEMTMLLSPTTRVEVD